MTSSKSFLIYILFSCFMSGCFCKSYHNYTLYRGLPVKDNHLVFFNKLADNFDVNFWRAPGVLFKPVELVINPKDRDAFLREADKLNLYLRTVIEDVQSEFDKQLITPYIRRQLGTFNWKGYFRLNDINEWLADLQKEYPEELTLTDIGTTQEGRKIVSARVVLKGCKNRSNVIIEGGIHAREWIGPAFVTYMLHEILRASKGTNQKLKDIALTYHWYFVPVMNPDGYEYSHTTDRMWRKNRSKPAGVDLNRNFDFNFGGIDCKKRKSSEVYCGPNAFSENETKAMSQFVTSKSDNLEYYFSFHSYGQDIVIPYSNSEKHLDNYDEMYAMAKEATEHIAQKYRTRYMVGTAFDVVGYKASGASGCWTKKNFGVPYVLYFELRDEGTHAFTLPPEHILPTCEETMDGMISLLKPRTMKLNKLKLGIPKKYKKNGQSNIALNSFLVFYYSSFIVGYLN